MQRQAAHLSRFDVGRRFKWPLYIALALGALLIPPVLSSWNPPFVRSIEYYQPPPFDLFAFFATATWLLIAYLELKVRRRSRLWALLPVLVPLLLALHFLIVLQQYQIKSYDYVSYEMGARAIAEGRSLYSNDAQQYLYWPLLAQLMGGFYLVMAWASTMAGGIIDDSETIWRLVFYFYSCLQYLLLLTAYFLCYRFATQLRVEKTTAALLIGVLFLFNNSLYATLHYNQMGLLLLCVSLGAILLLKSNPILSGILVAFGGHIKLYPYILLLPWTLKRQWRAMIAVGVASVAIVFVQTRAFQDWNLWQEYLVFARQWVDSSFFRENSLQNIIHNTVRQAGYLLGIDTSRWQPFAAILVVAAQAAMLAWYLWRFFAREKACTQATAGANSSEARDFYKTVTLYGHAVEVLAFALILSPLVWEHHYLLALPIAIWAVVTGGQRRPWTIALALILMLGLPTFNVYPFSYHRIIGLVMLLLLTPPQTLPALTAAPQQGAASPNTLDLRGLRHS